MSRLKAGLIITVAALLFGGVAIFYFRDAAKPEPSAGENPVATVTQEGVGQIPESCIKPKTFVLTQQKKTEEYQKMVETAIQQLRQQGASEEEIKKQTEQLAKSIASIALTEQGSLVGYDSQPDFFQVSTEQNPGKSVQIKHAELRKPGFVVVSLPLIGKADDSKFSAAYLLQPGVHNDFSVPLDRYMDRFEAYVSLYEDDGDTVFDRSKDIMLTYRRKGTSDDQAQTDPALFKVRFTSDRSLDQYQSVYLRENQKWEGLTALEQVPGQIVNLSVARSYAPAWIAIHESNGGCAGKVLGTYSLLDEPEVVAAAKKSGTYTSELAARYKDMHRQRDYFDIALSREVKNEKLVAVMYEDNGDGRFDLNTDMPLKGVRGEAVGIEFPVILGR